MVNLQLLYTICPEHLTLHGVHYGLYANRSARANMRLPSLAMICRTCSRELAAMSTRGS